MKTDAAQTAIACIDDNHGVSSNAYFNLRQMVADQHGAAAANRLNNIVKNVDGRYHIDINNNATVTRDQLDIYDYIVG